MNFYLQVSQSELVPVSSPAEAERVAERVREGGSFGFESSFPVLNWEANYVGAMNLLKDGTYQFSRGLNQQTLQPFLDGEDANHAHFYDFSAKSKEYPVVCVALEITDELASFSMASEISQPDNRLWGLFWFDPGRVVRSFDRQPSYELNPYGFAAKGSVSDALDREVRDCFNFFDPPRMTFHVSHIRSIDRHAFTVQPFDRSGALDVPRREADFMIERTLIERNAIPRLIESECSSTSPSYREEKDWLLPHELVESDDEEPYSDEMETGGLEP